jgi:hypothetical protein
MEAMSWGDLLEDDDLDTCLSKGECIDDLIKDSSAGCLYCRISELEQEDDD